MEALTNCTSNCAASTRQQAKRVSSGGQIGNQRELAAALKQADALNREGYGVYFAPCLRKTRQGKAEAAALVSALWVDIDCDGDERQREDGLEKLRGFDPAPSFIIASGGGWHGYWLLDEPFHLADDTARQKIAAILRGLFAVLGGDPEYVKTVAGIMRLPEIINTKSERSGSVVGIVECHPERRYPLPAFAWLENQARTEKIGSLNVITMKGNGHHPLPTRTEDYLTSGAVDGQRNDELFAAACQMRDARYSQSDAERELIPRYLTDGTNGEHLAAREREARATITSAYSHPPREPIPEPRQAARAQVNDLGSRFGKSEADRERPTIEQITAAVTACTHLNAVQWAAERQRLKVLCGDGLKIADLECLYREAKRDLERVTFAAAPTAERYIETDGCMVFEKQNVHGTSHQIVADWTARVLEWITRLDDDGQFEHIMRLRLDSGGKVTTLDVLSELFGDPNALQRFIAQKAGGIYAVRAGMNKHLVSAVLKLSAEPPQHQTYGFVGWT